MATIQEALGIWRQWTSQGESVASATVVRVAGSAPRPEGSRFLVSGGGDMFGSVSGGCVENDVFLHATEVLQGAESRLITYGIADEEAFEVGLACGGTIQVFVDQMDPDIAAAAAVMLEGDAVGTLATVVAGPHRGLQAVLDRDGSAVAGGLPPMVTADVAADAVRLADVEQARTLGYGEEEVFIEPLAPPPRLVVWGADEVAVSLSSMAKEIGFHVVVCDPRPAFAVPDRFPAADEVVAGWPGDLAGRVPIDSRTYVVTLTHDGRVEGPLLPMLLESEVRYIGSMGSRRTHAVRMERLAAAGWGDDDLARIHGPVGLDIGAERPAEVAVSILAEMIQARYHSGSGLSLSGREGRIHRHRPGDDADV